MLRDLPGLLDRGNPQPRPAPWPGQAELGWRTTTLHCQAAKASSRLIQVMARGDIESYPARPSAWSPSWLQISLRCRRRPGRTPRRVGAVGQPTTGW